MITLPKQPLEVGHIALVTTDAPVRWIVPPQKTAEIREYADHLIVNPTTTGEILFGADDDKGRTWTTLKAGAERAGWNFGWLKNLVPSWSAVRAVLPWLLVAGLVAWLMLAPAPGPGPVPPVPPVPPTPVPSKPPAPIPGDGLRVLVVYETADLAKLTKGQLDSLYGKDVRDYLNAKCPMGPDGKTHEWRIWDKDTDVSAEGVLWQDAMKRPRATLPWAIISNGKTGFEGPLPDDLLATLKKYGGDS